MVVNPNTSNSVTERIARSLKPHIGEGTEITCVNAEAGPEGIDTLLDVALAGIEAVRVIVQNRNTYDAFIIACGDDPGLDVARQVTSKPVIGIAEAGMLMACLLGAKFSVLTALRAEIPRVQELVNHYGLSSRLASVLAVGLSTAELISSDELYRRNVSAGRKAVEEDMAEVIVLTGSVLGGLEIKLSQDLGVPVLSGLICALKLAEDMIDLGGRTSHIYKYSSLRKHDKLIGYEDLQEVYSI